MKLVSKIVLPIVLFVLFLLGFIAVYSQRSLRAALIRDEFLTVREMVLGQAAQHLHEEDFTAPDTERARRDFMTFLQDVADPTTARVTFWNVDSRIIFSDLPSIIGSFSPGREDLKRVLAGNGPEYAVWSRDTGNPMQTDVGEYVDIIVPMSFSGRLRGVVEVHSVVGAVLAPIGREMRTASYLLILGALLLLAVILLTAQRFIGSPLRKIGAFIADIGSGRFDRKIEIRSRDEIGELGDELNRMSVGLKRLEELRNEFVFIASHELRAPVTVIGGYLSLLEDLGQGAVTPSAEKYLENIRSANGRLAQLVSDILNIARSEAGKLQVAVAPCELEAEIRSIIGEQGLAAEKKKMSVIYEPAAAGMVLADSGRLKEVIANLLTNAIKYTPEGGKVTVRHEAIDGEVVTHVEDTGYGIPAEEQKQVFEKFFRSGEREIRSAPGTGLGLFITKQLVLRMGGRIWFRSEIGKGSTFSFSLKYVVG